MTTTPRRLRLSAPSLAISLAVGLVGVLHAPAAADTTTTFGQSTKLYVGGRNNNVETTGGPLVLPNQGPASQYPSTLSVAYRGAITDVDVTLHGISHTHPDDLDVMLVGPGGQQVTLMSDAASSNDLVDANLTFSDSAGAGLPDQSAITQSEARPTDWSTDTDPFPAPAPTSDHTTSLAVFNGTDAAGTWRLYVLDDTGGDTGSIAGWSLSIDQDSTAYPSTVEVGGLPSLSDVDVRLDGLTSTYPDDLALLLVGPGGQQATLLAETGGQHVVDGVDLVLDDEAPGALPDETALASGTYQPASYFGGTVPFPDPAPVATGQTPLAAFDGTNPNGVWKLYAYDAASGDTVSIDGWSLDLAWSESQRPSGSVVIDGGAATTATPSVRLDLSASDPAPSSGLDRVRLSNDGTTFSAYQPYVTSAAWTLSAGDGVKTVYAQFRDKDGNESAVVSDTIALTSSAAPTDTSGPTATRTTPRAGARKVPVSTTVKVRASESLKAGSVTRRTVFLKGRGSANKVRAEVRYDARTRTVVLDPARALERRTTYTLTVTTGVRDVAGNAFDAKSGTPGPQALTLRFRTA
ncbi:hypothetical protein HN031_02260 [Nocardioides sp. zg-1308]|uniref:proprotein convertase P-domain-containing protein n=1 Tax=Nocardioides sp. zg-1308 TaxID=2736253 RepID=UPI001551AF62|nr:proprotein convertase P-domain-containing protein [Nocardioides sp. zg-1308]NPD03507.1 hypothetical protein [Nocardioides sp. zg-1308]